MGLFSSLVSRFKKTASESSANPETRKLPTVKFDRSRVANPEIIQLITDYVMNLEGIDKQKTEKLLPVAIESVARGGDLAYLSNFLQNECGFDKKRAANVSVTLHTQTTSLLQIQRQKNIGIQYAVWLHSHAGRHQRPSHIAADGKIFCIDKGMMINGEWVFPGRLISCRCSSRPLIPGIDYKSGKAPVGFKDTYHELAVWNGKPDPDFMDIDAIRE
jgi:uncharacterized protein with gpF-like domain